MSDNDSVHHMTQPYADICDFFMFDTLGAGYGGTGKKFDWEMLQRSPPAKPYFLSGGIESDDEKKLERFLTTPAAEKLFAIDINTKFEIGPGVKDLNSIKKFAEGLGIKK
jgi:phosphoribosylanthranilate isomerase